MNDFIYTHSISTLYGEKTIKLSFSKQRGSDAQIEKKRTEKKEPVGDADRAGNNTKRLLFHLSAILRLHVRIALM